MDSRRRFAAVAAVLALGAIIAFVVTQNKPSAPSKASNPLPTSSANCLQPKKPIPTPSWFPTDLPLPAGSFATEEPKEQSGLLRVIFTVNGSLRDFVVHALTTWKQQGYVLGRGEAEPGEAEDNFLKNKRYGIFRAQAILCDQNTTWVLVVMNDPSKKAVPTPAFTQHTTASPSPLQ